MSGIKFRKPPCAGLPPAWAALVTAIREAVASSRFDALDQLGNTMYGRPATTEHHERKRISELAGGTRFPDQRELKKLITTCDPETWPRTEALWRAAGDERARLGGAPAPAKRRGERRRSLPRLFDRHRESLIPTVLTPMPRMNAIERELTRGSSRSGVTFLIGEGGLGKSVLLGQILDHITSGYAGLPRSAVLVSCNAVDPGQATAPEHLDQVLAVEAGITNGGSGMLDLLCRMQTEHGSVALVVDTLDVLLADSTFRAIAAFLARALEFAEVIATCRSSEFLAYFGQVHQSAPALTGRIREVMLPELGGPEILEWTAAYLHRSGSEIDVEQRSFLDSLRDGVAQPGPLRRVCGVPVRLALTCEIFSKKGRVPQDLTVTKLYQDYWRDRIHTHTGRALSQQAVCKEAAALEAASRIVSGAGMIALRIPKGPFAREHRDGAALLVSEGVLRDLDVGWEFFHQSFAEFAHARWALSQGPTSEAVAALRDGVVAGQRHLWPIVGSLLLQVDTDDDYQQFADAIPGGDPEGAKYQVLSALDRGTSAALERALDVQAGAPDALVAVLRVIGEIPVGHLDVGLAAALRALTDFPTQLTGPAVATLAALLPRLGPEALPEGVATALDTLLAIKGDLPLVVWEQHAGTLLAPFVVDGLPGEALTLMWPRFKPLESLGRQAVVRSFLAQPRSSTEAAAAAEAAFRSRCPPLSEPEQIRFLMTAWESTELRAQRGWTDWRDMLGEELADGWINAQILLTTHFAREDPAVLDAAVGDLLTGRMTAPERHINVLLKLVRTHGDDIADQLLAAGPPSDAVGIGGVVDCAEEFAAVLSSDRRTRLMHWLENVRDAQPRRVWWAQAVLSAPDPELCRSLFVELATAVQPPDVVGSAVDGCLHNAPSAVLAEVQSALRPLLDGPRERDRRARLEAKLAPTDPTARQWITEQMLRGPSSVAAGTAMTVVTEALDAGHPADRELTAWLATLVPSRHSDAVRRLTSALARPESVPDESLRPVESVRPVLRASAILKRIEQTVDRQEDGQLTGGLINLWCVWTSWTPSIRTTSSPRTS